MQEIHNTESGVWYAESAIRFIDGNIVRDMPEIQNTEYGFYYNVLQKDIDILNLQFIWLIGILLSYARNSKYWIRISMCYTKILMCEKL